MFDLAALPAPFAVLDGGFATELERDGVTLDDRLWSAAAIVDDPAAVARVHQRYAQAGAELISTATYQATEHGLRAHGVDPERVAEVWRRAAELARNAAPRRVLVGSLGSYGAALADGSEYRGRYGVTAEILRAFHRPRLDALGPHVDVLALETVPDADEARALAELLDDSPGPGAWISFSCRDATTLHDGRSLAALARELAGSRGVVALGVNCCAPELVEAAVGTVAEAAGLPVVSYPNSGEAWVDRAWDGHAEDAQRFSERAEAWWRAGARIMGGCCRTGPAHVRALVQARDELRARLTP